MSGVIVCQCKVVSDEAVAAAVRAGARSVAQVCRSTGAGRDCGSCVFAVKRLVCEVHDTLPTTQEVGSAAG